MKKFKDFVNEGLIDKMKPKSNDDIIKSLDKLSKNEKIKKIIEYNLDFNLLPRNEDGYCVIDTVMYLERKNEDIKIPNKLIVNGDFFLCILWYIQYRR